MEDITDGFLIQLGVGEDKGYDQALTAEAVGEEVVKRRRLGFESTLRRLHANLGHPSNEDMANASDMVIRAARDFKCSVCDGRKQPKLVRPAALPATVAPLRLLEMDVKELRGWTETMKVKCLNVVCASSSLQQVIPFFETETGEVLRQTLYQSWIRP